MKSFPTPALDLIAKMRIATQAEPHRCVAFQGAPGANTHRAAMEYAPDSLPLPCFSFSAALDAVKQGVAAYAMIPIENSQAGRVADIHFLLPESGLSIVGEYFMPIHHALMALPNADGSLGPFEAAYSHPHALSQSRQYLAERNIVPLSHADTAGAAAHVKETGDPTIAAIAPVIAADLYGLSIADNRVEDSADNTTRFVALAPQPLKAGSLAGQDAMTTFIFEVSNEPAALYKALGCFADNGVNMTKLESYQKGASFAATMFYTDIVGAPGDPSVDRALEQLAACTLEVRMLGTYRQGLKRG